MPETETPTTTVVADATKGPPTAVERRAAAIKKLDELNTAKTTTADTTSTTEAPKVEAGKESRRYADILRREQTIVLKQKDARAREAAVEAKEKALAEREKKLQEFESTLTKDPLGALKSKNISYEDLSRQYLNEGKPDPSLQFRSLQDELAAFRAEQKSLAEQQSKAEQERMAQEAQAVRQDFMDEINEHLSANKGSYVLTRVRSQSGLIAALIEEDWKAAKANGENRKPMSIQKAADMVEEYLKKQREQEDKEYTESKKAVEAPKTEVKAETKPPERRSLTNDLSGKTGETFVKRPMTAKEYRERALARADQLLGPAA